MIEAPSSLPALYDYLNKHCLQHPYSGQQLALYGVALTFRKVAERLEKSIFFTRRKKRERKHAQWEDFFCGFELYYNDFFHSAFVKKGDDYVPSHDPKDIHQDHISYLQQRLQTASHSLLLSRYAHLLYLKLADSKERLTYGSIALDNYLQLMEDLDREDLRLSQANDKKRRDLHRLYENGIINAMLLSMELREQQARAKNSFLEILRGEKCIEWIVLLQFMLQYKAQFSPSDFEGLQERCFQIGMEVMEPRDPQYSGVAIEYFEAGKELAAICGAAYPWDQVIESGKQYLEDILIIFEQIQEEVDKFRKK
ncbi:MAG: hypothetical protein AAFV95_18505 [Bacteroidota bacterium]